MRICRSFVRMLPLEQAKIPAAKLNRSVPADI
jgi:hypothetical protein